MDAATVLTIGTFDGVHRAHQALVARAREAAGSSGRVVALSFDPHPLRTLRPDRAPLRLTSFDQRRRWLIQSGADEVQRLNPTPEFLARSSQEFIDWMVRQYQPSAVVEGPDFRFGRGRAGSVQTLHEAGLEHGFDVHVLEPVHGALVDQSVVRVSSSLVRWMIRHGRVRDAAALCGRPFELEGPVTRGDQRGRELGIATANLQVENDQLLPADGIYAGRGILPDGATFPAAISVGTKPTFGDQPRVCEAHLLGFAGAVDDYGWPLRLQFLDWVRDQIRYEDVEALVEQIRRDCDLIARIAVVSSPTESYA